MTHDNWRRIILKDCTRTGETKVKLSPQAERQASIDVLKKSAAKTEHSLAEAYKEIEIIKANTGSTVDKLKQKITRNELLLEKEIQKIQNILERDSSVREIKRKRRNTFWWCFGAIVVIAGGFLAWTYVPMSFWEKILLYIPNDLSDIRMSELYF